MKRGYVLKEKSKDQKNRRSKKNIKNEPHKNKQKKVLKVLHIQMPLLLVYFMQIKLLASCKKCHNSWWSCNIILNIHAFKFDVMIVSE